MKKILFVFIPILLLQFQLSQAQVPSYVPSNGLIGYWPFSGNANDISGNGSNGTINGATLTTDRNGNANSAYNYDGLTNYINLNKQLPNNFTMSLWAYVSAYKSYTGSGYSDIGSQIIGTYNNNVGSSGFLCGLNGLPASYGQHYASFWNASNYDTTFATSSLSLNQWKNLTITFDGNNLKYYVNGVLESNITATFTQNNKTLYVGAREFHLSGPNFFFKGKIDDIGIWNRALTPQEITNLYNSCTTLVPTGNPTQILCATQTPTVAQLTATGTNIQWYAAATGGSPLPSTTALIDSTTYYASQTVTGCESDDRFAVTVSFNDPQITASETTVCIGTAVTLTASTSAIPVANNCTLPSNLQNGLVGYWPFCGNADDTSGNGNNGSVNGATLTTDRFGNANNAYSFDGNNYIRINNNSNLNNNSVTISGWFSTNTNATDTYRGAKAIIGKWWQLPSNCNSNYNSHLLCLTTPNNESVLGFATSFYSGNDFYFQNTILISNWYHFVVVHDANNGGRIYINGDLVSSNNTTGAICSGTNPINIGCDVENGVRYRFFNGKIDDIAIYNRALSTSEITQLYNSNQATYLWSTGETTATINPTPTATTTYWCDVTVNGVTCRKEVTITVNPIPLTPTGNTTQIFCATPAPTVAQLTASGTGIQWYATATGGTPLATTTALVDGTTYYASQTANGCESITRLAVTVGFNDPQITASATTVCSGTAVTITAGTTALSITNNCTLPSNLQTGLVGYWPFCGNANDVSGNGNNGTVNGATLTTDRNGNANSAYNFDGVNDFIQLQTPSLNNAITISFWAFDEGEYPNTYSINPRYVSAEFCNGGFSLFNNVNNLPNGLFFTRNRGLSSADIFSTVLSTYQVNQHIVMSYDGSVAKFYINGNLVSSINNSGNIATSANLFFGKSGCNNAGQMIDAFKGKLDDIGMWNRALTQQEITQLYNQGQTTYLWSTGTTTPTINPTTTATTTYWCDVTVNGVTCRKDVTITVNPIPLTPTGNTTQIFCATPAPTVAQLTATGTNIQWYAAATGGSPLASTTALIDGTTYYASQTVNGCESTTRLAVTVDFNDPQITASASTVCSGTAVTLTASTTATPVANNCTLPSNLQNGLVGYWPFCGNANDVSGNGNNGTVIGATLTTDRFGNANSAYNFDGVNDYINIPQNNIFQNMNNVTFNFWLKTNQLTNGNLLKKGNSGSISSGEQFNFQINFANQPNVHGYSVKYGSNCNPGINWVNNVSNLTINDNKWYMITGVIDLNNIKYFVNGNLINSTSVSSYLDTCLSDLNFGLNWLEDPDYYNGIMDDIGIWNRALTQLEIQQLFTPATSYLWSTGATTPTISPTPIATTTYWCDVTVNGVTCRKEITINVNSTTPVPTGDATQVFCVSPAPTVADLTATGSNIQWYDTTSGGNLLSSTTALVDGTTYYASQTISNCESDSRLAVTVSFNDSQITASATTVCSGTAVTLTASTPATPITNNCTLPTNLQNGLVGYWPFCGNADDVSGNGNNGTVNGATLTDDRFGNANSAYSFDGTNDYIEIGNSYQIDAMNDFTISTWYLTNTISPQFQFLVSKDFMGDPPTGDWDLYFNYNKVKFSITLNTNNYFGLSNASIPINIWNNLVITRNSSSGIIKTYINGILDNTFSGYIGLYSNTQKMNFGRQGSSNQHFFNGKLDEIGIWNRALTPTEITKLYNQEQYNYLWSTGETTATINPTPTANTSYWCDVTVNGVTCRKEITVTVNPILTPTFSQVAAICSGATLTALPTTSNNGITGTWSPALDNTATTTYTFTPTAGQCATTATMTITVNPNITPTFTQVAAICSGATLSALPTTSNNGITGTWSPALNNTATTTYTFTPTAGQCAQTTTMTITVNPNITPTFTQVAAFCSGATLSALPTTSSNSITGTWSPALDNTATTTYTFTPTAGQCATTATMTITVNPNITPTFTQVTAICSGATLSALPTTSNNGITGMWSPALDNTATTTYTFTPTAGQCATTATMTITVNPNITPTFTQGAAICSGATLTALPTTSNNGITGTWSPALNNTATTTYTFTPDAGQCSTTATMTITVNPNITPTFTQIAAICSGASLGALPTTSNNGIIGTWSPALNNSGTTTYTFTPDAGQCATTATMTITVNPNITPTFTQVAAICSEATLTALPNTSNNGITGTWSPALDNTATTTYTFTPTAGQCATTATMTITVNPNITPTFTQVAAICSGTTLSTLPTTSNNGITGTWSPALNNTATTTYTFTPDAGQCATTATMTITVNPNITPTFTQIAAICSGATLSALPTTSNNGITGTWSPALNNNTTTTYTFTPTAGQCATIATMTITVNLNITPLFAQVAAICSGATLTALPTTSNNGITGTWSPALNNSATTTYTFTPTAGQCATTATMTITVNPNITPTFTQVTAICSGATLTALPTTSNNVITGTWSPALDNTATTTYTFTPTAGQCATTATMTITVNPNITPTFTQVTAICSGATLTALPTTSNNVITGMWSPTLDNTATTTYTFTPTAGQCATTATMTITVNPLPNEPTGNNQPMFCAIDNPTINDLVLNTNNIHWYLNATGGNILANNYLLTDGQILYAAAYDAITLCESNTRYQVIVSVENPTLPILGTIIEFCKELNATVSAIDTQGVSMVWYDSPTGNTTIPLDYILQDGDVLYGAALNTSTNCESTERVMIQISILDTALDYYNLITIDDNQRNTALKIIGIERFASNSIEIYNRYGTLVWSAINYDNSINAFKGMANVSGVVSKNSYLPSGTYFFILKYPNSCKQTELKGYIHLENKK